LERVRELLQVLVVERLQASLLRLLSGLTGAELSLSSLQSGSLSPCAERGKLLGRASPHAIEALPEPLLSLRGLQGLLILLLAEALIGLTKPQAHTKLLLGKISELTGCRQLGCTVCLLGTKAELLLLLSRLQGLLVAATEKIRKGAAPGQLLLSGKIGGSNACPVATKGARANGISKLTHLSLLGLSPHKIQRAPGNRAEIRVHVLPDLSAA
jgi:hypothetical protein